MSKTKEQAFTQANFHAKHIAFLYSELALSVRTDSTLILVQGIRDAHEILVDNLKFLNTQVTRELHLQLAFQNLDALKDNTTYRSFLEGLYLICIGLPTADLDVLKEMQLTELREYEALTDYDRTFLIEYLDILVDAKLTEIETAYEDDEDGGWDSIDPKLTSVSIDLDTVDRVFTLFGYACELIGLYHDLTELYKPYKVSDVTDIASDIHQTYTLLKGHPLLHDDKDDRVFDYLLHHAYLVNHEVVELTTTESVLMVIETIGTGDFINALYNDDEGCLIPNDRDLIIRLDALLNVSPEHRTHHLHKGLKQLRNTIDEIEIGLRQTA